MKITKTYSRILGKEQNSLLWEMARESAKNYNHLLKLYPTNQDFNSIQKQVEKEIKRNYLHSHSQDGAYQLAIEAIKSYFPANKRYKSNPSCFTGAPQFPKPDKFIQTIIFKKSAIRFKDGFLLLSTKFKNNPIKVKWSEEIGLPIFATIKMDCKEWHLCTVFKEESPNLIKGNKILAIDLGIKRIGTTFDGDSVETYNGKEIMSLVQLENKKRAEIAIIKEQRKKKYSRSQKRKLKGIRKQIQKVKNKKKDALHKLSRYLVNKAINNGVCEIVAGDCANIHQKSIKARSKQARTENNQKINQGQEQKFYKMVEYKFERIGGKCSLIDEAYSTQTCPVCGNRYKPNGREYKCAECKFIYDRDGVGAINIYSNKVSFKLERSGLLARPRGVKYSPQLSHKLVCGEDRSSKNYKLV